MLKGIAASSGIAIAKAYKLETPEIVIELKECNPQKKLKSSIKLYKKARKTLKQFKKRQQEDYRKKI
ncbi:MAG: phosphoenolpyruvate-utilizing N-terminal domain-containing protein [Erysipelotrichaceae bacterium]